MNNRIPKVLFAALLALAVSASVHAEAVPVKFAELVELGGSLAVLDGIEHEVKTSDQGTRIIRIPLDLKAAPRIAIAKDIAAVRTALAGFESQRMKLLQTVSPGAIEKVQGDPVLLAKFRQLWEDYIKDAVKIDVVLLTEEQLNLDANKEIVGSVLAGLSPILKK